ncbi:MAG: polyprenyl synthetase family protein [Bacteroidota bacterium]
MPDSALANAAVALLSDSPQVQTWPALQKRVAAYQLGNSGKHPCDYVRWACTTAGGSAEAAVPGMAAIFACMESIRLVDDLLDEDPDGLQHEVGTGTTANLAVALQALAHRAVHRSTLTTEAKEQVLHCLDTMMLDTAHGQNEELGSTGTEEEYWRIVRLKTPPLFKAALYVGCRLGGTDLDTAQQVSTLGRWLGLLTQVSDDLHDVLQDKVTPDWLQPNKNLALLFMQVAEYPGKEEFLERLAQVEHHNDLAWLQQQLISQGAISYGCNKIVELFQQGNQQAWPESFALPAKQVFRTYLVQVEHLLTQSGIAVPEFLRT